MSEVVVLLFCEGRNFHLKLTSGKLIELQNEFELIFAADPVFNVRRKTHVPTFSWKKSDFLGTPFEDLEFEILSTDVINNLAIISVKWTEGNEVRCWQVYICMLSSIYSS